MKMRRCLPFLLSAVPMLAGVASAGELPWNDTKLVFGETFRGTTNVLDAAASATEVLFEAPATLVGATLTMLPPARISGEGGVVLNPLAGSDGLLLGLPYGGEAFYGSKTAQVLWKDVRLADVEFVTGCMCGTWGGGGKVRPDHVYFEKAVDGLSATLQLQAWQINQWTRTVLLRLEQSGADVVATLVWAKYSSAQSSNGQDWLKNPSAATAGTHGEYNDFPQSDTGIGINVTDLRPYGAGTLTVAGPFPAGTISNNVRRLIVTPRSDLVLDNAICGSGQEIVYRNELGAVQTFEHLNAWIGTEEILVSDNATIGSVVIGDVYICGQYVNADCSLPEKRANFGTWSETVNGVRTIQLQYNDYGGANNHWTKTVTLQFRQDGTRVWVKALNMCYASGDCRGQHVTSNASTPCTSGSPANRGSCNAGYGVWNLSLTCRSGQHAVSFSGSGVNAMVAGSRFTLDGVIDATCSNLQAFPQHCELVLTNGTCLSMRSAGGTFFQTAAEADKPFTFTVTEGCELGNYRDWAVGPYVVLNLLGGRYNENNVNYLGWINMSNGAVVEGRGSIRAGYYDGVTCWRTLPGTDCTIAVPIDAAKRSRTQYPNVHTFDLAADLHLRKPIYDLTGTQLFGLNWAKTGPATLHFEADTTMEPARSLSPTVGAFNVFEGTLACDANHVLSGENPIALKGGTLAAGSYTNAFGVLSVTTNSAITLAEGAQLSFADSSAAEWTAGLAITGPWEYLGAGNVRFGTTDAGLTLLQRQRITYNGQGHAYLDRDGWLMTVPRGCTVFVR